MVCFKNSLCYKLRKLQRESEEFGDQFIIYKKGKYGPSLEKSATERDRYYREHESEVINEHSINL